MNGAASSTGGFLRAGGFCHPAVKEHITAPPQMEGTLFQVIHRTALELCRVHPAPHDQDGYNGRHQADQQSDGEGLDGNTHMIIVVVDFLTVRGLVIIR